MKSIGSRLLILAIIFCIIFSGIGLFFYSRLPDIASKQISKYLQVTVRIKDILLRPSTIEIDQIHVANVPGGKLTTALSVETTTLTAPLLNYLHESIVIEEIALDKVYLGLEFDSSSGTQGNWSILMNNLKKEQKKETPQKKTTIFIKKLVLTNIQTDVIYIKDGNSVIKLKPIDRIELTNISSEEGISTSQIMNSVLGQMLKSVFTQENLKNMLEGILQEPSQPLDSLMQPFKNLFGG